MVGDSCSCQWLSDQLSTDGSLISLIDCRPQTEYSLKHVISSINLTIPTLMMRRLLRGNLPMTSVISCIQQSRPDSTVDWKTQTIVLYDGAGGTETLADSSPSLASLLQTRFKQEGYKVCLLDGGFERFQKTYSHLCTSESDSEMESALLGVGNLRISACESHLHQSESHLHQSESHLHQSANGCERRKDLDQSCHGLTSVCPVEVVHHLFLGDAHNAADLKYLNDKGIKYIINVTHDIPNQFASDGHFKYLTIPISDHWSQNLSAYFPQAIRFIDEAVKAECGVLVHCLAGISRSVTITIAYLMATKSLSLNDAYDFVKRCKPNVSPNLNFMGQLLDFEKELRLGCRCEDVGSVDVSARSVCEGDTVSSGVITSPPGSGTSSLSSTALTLSCTSTSSTFNYDNILKQ